MDLKNAQLGDQYRVFINADNELTDSPHKRTMLATVIAISKPQYGESLILGWKRDEERPANVSSRANTSSENNYVPNQALFTYGKSVKRTLQVAIQIHKGLDGFPCKKCKTFYPQALANQDDGTLICWSCRNRW